MMGSSPTGAIVAIGQWQSGRLWLCLRGFDSPWSPHGWVCLEARAADCKSVTKKHRRFDSCPIHFSFACPRGLWCHPAKVVCGNAPKVRILSQTLSNMADKKISRPEKEPWAGCPFFVCRCTSAGCGIFAGIPDNWER